MDGALPERDFAGGEIEAVVCTMLHMPGFGWRFVPYLRPSWSDRHLGVSKARDGLRSYADVPRMVGWLGRSFGYTGPITLIPADHKMATDLALVSP